MAGRWRNAWLFGHAHRLGTFSSSCQTFRLGPFRFYSEEYHWPSIEVRPITPEPLSAWTDALAPPRWASSECPWCHTHRPDFVLLFPPLPRACAFIAKALQDQAHSIAILPCSHTAPWWPSAMSAFRSQVRSNPVLRHLCPQDGLYTAIAAGVSEDILYLQSGHSLSRAAQTYMHLQDPPVRHLPAGPAPPVRHLACKPIVPIRIAWATSGPNNGMGSLARLGISRPGSAQHTRTHTTRPVGPRPGPAP